MLFLKWHIIHLKLVIEMNQSSAGAVSEFVQVLRGSSASGQWGNTEGVQWHILFIYLSQWADHKVFLLQKKAFLGNRVQLPVVILGALWIRRSQTALCMLRCQEQIFMSLICVFIEQIKLQLAKQHKNGHNEKWWEQTYLTLVRHYAYLEMTKMTFTT